jgi:hypothetical protein
MLILGASGGFATMAMAEGPAAGAAPSASCWWAGRCKAGFNGGTIACWLPANPGAVGNDHPRFE